MGFLIIENLVIKNIQVFENDIFEMAYLSRANQLIYENEGSKPWKTLIHI